MSVVLLGAGGWLWSRPSGPAQTAAPSSLADSAISQFATWSSEDPSVALTWDAKPVDQSHAPGPALSAILSNQGLVGVHANLAAHFPATPAGRSVAILAALEAELVNAATPAEQYATRQLRALTRRPAETIEAIREGLSGLPGEILPEKRLFLLKLAAQLELDERTRIEFLLTEARRESADPEPARGTFANQAEALELAYAIVQYDPLRTEALLTDALEPHRGRPEAQQLLLMSYARLDPEKAAALTANLGLVSAPEDP